MPGDPGRAGIDARRAARRDARAADRLRDHPARRRRTGCRRVRRGNQRHFGARCRRDIRGQPAAGCRTHWPVPAAWAGRLPGRGAAGWRGFVRRAAGDAQERAEIHPHPGARVQGRRDRAARRRDPEAEEGSRPRRARHRRCVLESVAADAVDVLRPEAERHRGRGLRGHGAAVAERGADPGADAAYGSGCTRQALPREDVDHRRRDRSRHRRDRRAQHRQRVLSRRAGRPQRHLARPGRRAARRHRPRPGHRVRPQLRLLREREEEPRHLQHEPVLGCDAQGPRQDGQAADQLHDGPGNRRECRAARGQAAAARFPGRHLQVPAESAPPAGDLYPAGLHQADRAREKRGTHRERVFRADALDVAGTYRRGEALRDRSG